MTQPTNKNEFGTLTEREAMLNADYEGYDLMDYYTAEVIREATPEETQESLAAGEEGVIVVEIDGMSRRCYVMEP